MPANVQQRGKKFQLRVIDKLLPKPFFHTFDTYEQADNYGKALETLLAQGVVPVEMLEVNDKVQSPRLVDVIDLYVANAPVTESDTALLKVVGTEVVGLRVSGLDYVWVESYVRRLKVVLNLAPGTIRKRVECLARVVDWHLLKTLHNKSGNPLRMLPRGYSTYSAQDRALLPTGKGAKEDVSRDRRITLVELERVRQALSGVKREGRQRAWGNDPAFAQLFELILDTGMRLKEAYRLRVNQVDFGLRIIRAEGTKGNRGVLKPRSVPLRARTVERLRVWCGGREGLMFPFWDGTKEDEIPTTKRLSVRFASLFSYADVVDATEHDLRHTATCDWFELRAADGRWVFSEIEICKIMGWSDTKMALRYASLRGEDLSSRLL